LKAPRGGFPSDGGLVFGVDVSGVDFVKVCPETVLIHCKIGSTLRVLEERWAPIDIMASLKMFLQISEYLSSIFRPTESRSSIICSISFRSFVVSVTAVSCPKLCFSVYVRKKTVPFLFSPSFGDDVEHTLSLQC
jgi:hypothetical protein